MDFSLEELAKYPFLNASKKYVAEMKLNLETLDKHFIYSSAIKLGELRAIDAINLNVPFKFLNIERGDKASMELAILSYVLARIFVNLIGNKWLVSKFARGEAENAFYHLKNESKDTLERIQADLGIDLRSKMDFYTYLSLTRELSIKDKKWKLVNRILEKGKVQIRPEEKKILLKEAIFQKVAEPISISNVPKKFIGIAKSIEAKVTRIKDTKTKLKDIDQERLPPCIKEQLSRLERGDISHHGRFLLATFFINLSLDIEKIEEIFRRSPNFNEKMTRYQLEFLAGKRSKTRYLCPNCSKIKSYGLCVDECNITNPMQYYYKKSKNRNQ